MNDKFNLSESQVNRFTKWLRGHGVEILPISNDYEVLRFRGAKVGILYTTGAVNSIYTAQAIDSWQNNKRWTGGPSKVASRKGSYKSKKIQVFKRDGDLCFYCGKYMSEEDMTIEHLISLNDGGTNKLSNMVLAHNACNHAVGHRPLNEKVEIAIKKRTQG